MERHHPLRVGAMRPTPIIEIGCAAIGVAETGNSTGNIVKSEGRRQPAYICKESIPIGRPSNPSKAREIALSGHPAIEQCWVTCRVAIPQADRAMARWRDGAMARWRDGAMAQ